MTCDRENELLDALGRGYIGSELEAHVATCAACGELRAVAGALLDDRTQAVAAARVPSAGTMWWRMRLRARREAQAASRRALLAGQAVTVTIAITLVIVFFRTALPTTMHELVAAIRDAAPLLVVLAATLLAAPVAGWVVARGK
jgi:hypothetical protein